MWSLIHSEFIAWAKEEAGRIKRGESKPYHAALLDPPYGLEFMGKEWDAPHKNYAAITEGNNYPGGRRKSINFTGSPNLTCKKCGGLAVLKSEGSGGRKKCRCENPSFPDYRNSALAVYQRWTTEWAKALLPLLYPGALVFAFGGTRTWHRLACGFEDAGFEAWDTLMFLHGQGFPKAQDIGGLVDTAACRERDAHPTKEWSKEDRLTHKCEPVSGSERWRGRKSCALKPAWEPILCFRAPRQGKNYAELALEHGSGALNVDGGRISGQPRTTHKQGNFSSVSKRDNTKFNMGDNYSCDVPTGRYPANLVLECICEQAEVVDAPDYAINRFDDGAKPFGGGAGHSYSSESKKGGKAIRHTDPNCPAYLLDEQAGESVSTGGKGIASSGHGHDFYSGYNSRENALLGGFGDKGGPSRFFYCAKSSRSEREQGCDSLPCTKGCKDGKHVHDIHPTIKPLSLCEWLAKLLLPPDSVKPRRLLIPFCGAGSEMIGAMQAGWDEIIGIEQSEEYVRIGEARMRHWEVEKEPSLF